MEKFSVNAKIAINVLAKHKGECVNDQILAFEYGIANNGIVKGFYSFLHLVNGYNHTNWEKYGKVPVLVRQEDSNEASSTSTQGVTTKETMIVYTVLDFDTEKAIRAWTKYLKNAGKYEYEHRYNDLKSGKEFDAHKIGSDCVRYLKKKHFKNTCECCTSNTPIVSKTLELHHIQAVEDGGKDSLNNFACVCRNCHGIIHGLDLVYDEQAEAKYSDKRRFFEEIVKPAVKQAYDGMTERKIKKFVKNMLLIRYGKEEEVA